MFFIQKYSRKRGIHYPNFKAQLYSNDDDNNENNWGDAVDDYDSSN